MGFNASIASNHSSINHHSFILKCYLRKKIDGAIKVCMQDEANLVRQGVLYLPIVLQSSIKCFWYLVYLILKWLMLTGPASMVVSPNIGWKPEKVEKSTRRRKRKSNVSKLLRTEDYWYVSIWSKCCCNVASRFTIPNRLCVNLFSFWHLRILPWLAINPYYVSLTVSLQDICSAPIGDVKTSNLNAMAVRGKAAASLACVQSSEAIKLVFQSNK